MPGVTTRRVEVQTLRTVPELWVPPAPGARGAARRRRAPRQRAVPRSDGAAARGRARPERRADHGRLRVPQRREGRPRLDLGRLGRRHQDVVRALPPLHAVRDRARVAACSARTRRTRARWCSTSRARTCCTSTGRTAASRSDEEALDALARARRRRAGRRSAASGSTRRARSAAGEGSLATDVVSRSKDEVVTYGWPPADFIREGLLRFCFAEDEDARTQVGFVEQRVRVQLARWAYPLENEPGASCSRRRPKARRSCSSASRASGATPLPAGAGHVVREFGDLVEFLTDRLAPESEDAGPGVDGGRRAGHAARLPAPPLRAGAAARQARRPRRQTGRARGVGHGGRHPLAPRLRAALRGGRAALAASSRRSRARAASRCASSCSTSSTSTRRARGTSPIKDVLVDIAARGRSLGVLLIGAQQSAGDVDGNIIRNAALKVAGRLDAGEASEYRFLTRRAARARRALPARHHGARPAADPGADPAAVPVPGLRDQRRRGALRGRPKPRRASCSRSSEPNERCCSCTPPTGTSGGPPGITRAATITRRCCGRSSTLAREHRPDLIIHAGDLFDAVRPPYEEIALALDTLHDLAAVAPTVVVCGNHDSPALFRIFQKLLGAGSRLRFVDRARPPADGGILDFAVGQQPAAARAAAVRAPEPPGRRVRGSGAAHGRLRRPHRRSSSRRCVEGLLDGYDGTRDVLLFAAHLHVTGARFSKQRARAPRLRGLRHSARARAGGLLRRVRPHPSPAVARRDDHRPLRRLADPARLRRGGRGERAWCWSSVEPGEPARVREIALEKGRRLRHFVGTFAQLEAAASTIARRDLPGDASTSPGADARPLRPRGRAAARRRRRARRGAGRRTASSPRPRSCDTGARSPPWSSTSAPTSRRRAPRPRPPIACSPGSAGSTRRWRRRRSRRSRRSGCSSTTARRPAIPWRRRRRPRPSPRSRCSSPAWSAAEPPSSSPPRRRR